MIDYDILADDEIGEIEKATNTIRESYIAVRQPSPEAIASLAAKDILAIPPRPLIIDAKQYYELPDDTDPQLELQVVWHGFQEFWLPNSRGREGRRQRLCFQRLQTLAPDLVDFIDERLPDLAEQNKSYKPDRLSVSLPLIASLDLMSKHLVSPNDSGAFNADGSIRHNYFT